jgi:hypothetical protein
MVSFNSLTFGATDATFFQKLIGEKRNSIINEKTNNIENISNIAQAQTISTKTWYRLKAATYLVSKNQITVVNENR